MLTQTELVVTATLNCSSDDLDYDLVEVYVGSIHVVTLPMTAGPSRAGHGDDSTYFDSENRRMIEETLAPYLQRIFTNPVNDSTT